MNTDPLNEREFELINIVGGELAFNQRDLSKKLSLSLGMTNMLIKRLVSKGYIRIRQLNKRKVEYLLTPKGFAEKMRKSIKYTVKTINSIGYIKDNLKKIILPLYEAGERKYIVLGRSDFAHLVDSVFSDIGSNDHTVRFVDDVSGLNDEDRQGIILIAKEETTVTDHNPQRVINLIHELAKFHQFQPQHEKEKELKDA